MINPTELRSGAKPSQWPVIHLPVGGRKQVLLTLLDQDGKAVDLKVEPSNPPATPPDWTTETPPEPSISSSNVKIKLRAKPSLTDDSVVIDIDGKIETGCPGQVSFLVLEPTAPAGVYVAEVGRFVDDGAGHLYLVDSWPCYLSFEVSVFATADNQQRGPLTIAELRMHLSDLELGEVSLLDELEFSDQQILHAIGEVVERWNETPPVLRGAIYTVRTFPYRHFWAKGAIAELYEMAARKYRRNQLDYSAGGIEINDQNKAPEYQQIADALQKEFDDWMMREKIRLNARRGWRTGL